ncbi:MAG TPA: M50 family metallopeptidase [Caulobacterales bacterium]|nr:M50 family metallopeptidase [Caulobacterales bacterium]
MAVLQHLLFSLLPFVVVLSVVVFVHEFGHFQAARWCKIAIDTFSIGFGKSLVKWRDRQGVSWKVGALPLGGYVKFADDADGVSMGPREQIDDPAAKAEARAKGMFHAQPVWKRAVVVAAGPFTNFVFAIIVFAFLLLMIGRDPPRIDEVRPGTPAAHAGLQQGDVIRALNGHAIESFRSLQMVMANSGAEPIAVDYQRGAQRLSATLTPVPIEGRLALGITHQSDPARYERLSLLGALRGGAVQTWEFVASTGVYLYGMVTGRNSGGDIAGPLGILSASGKVAAGALAGPQSPIDAAASLALSLLNFAAMLSVAVGLVNILPIPILDGGHLMFYAIEGLRGGRPLPPSAQEWAFRAGLAVMASLFLFATWNDITRHLWSQG